MKMKLITSAFTILSFMSLNVAHAQMSGCEKPTDIYVEGSHECVYCPNTLVWGGSAGLSCPGTNKCDHGTDVNPSKSGWCDYCSAGFAYDPAKKACEQLPSKK